MATESAEESYAHSTPVDTTHMSEDNATYEAVTGMYICGTLHVYRNNS